MWCICREQASGILVECCAIKLSHLQKLSWMQELGSLWQAWQVCWYPCMYKLYMLRVHRQLLTSKSAHDATSSSVNPHCSSPSMLGAKLFEERLSAKVPPAQQQHKLSVMISHDQLQSDCNPARHSISHLMARVPALISTSSSVASAGCCTSPSDCPL